MDGIELTPDKLSGKECLMCAARQPYKGVPHIHCGRFRTMFVCKKHHLTDECDVLAALLDHINKEVIERNDVRKSIMDGVSDDENYEIPMSKCSGHLDTEGHICNAECKQTLYVKEMPPKYFCKGSHLVKYLVRIYCGHKTGRKSVAKKT